MKKKSDNSIDSDKLLAELYVSTWSSLKDMTENSIKFYEYQCKALTGLLEIETDNEPLKIFKTKHKNWKNKISSIKQELDKAEKSLFNEYRELEDVLDLVDFSNKNNA